jgi:hypothetical protein
MADMASTSGLVSEKFGDNLLLTGGGLEFVATVLQFPVEPGNVGIRISSATLGSSTEFTVGRSFSSGDLILVQSNGSGVGIIYFAHLVGSGPAAG